MSTSKLQSPQGGAPHSSGPDTTTIRPDPDCGHAPPLAALPSLPRARVHHSRTLERSVVGMATSDGAGVRLTRLLSQSLHRRLDPFLMLDAFVSDDPDDYIAGFPPHPHRGFETVTYMIAGRLRHEDSAGHQGLLESGGVQWMHAARGVIHSEMPEQESGRMEGFQLWLNLPADRKLSDPWYRDFEAGEIPAFSLDDGTSVRVIAGSSHGVVGAVQREVTQPLILDVSLAAGGRFSQPLAPDCNGFVHQFRGDRGALTVSGSELRPGELGLLANDPAADGVELQAREACRVLLVAARPLNEPIVQYGPFVMNRQEEIAQAMDDYRSGRMGQIRVR